MNYPETGASGRSNPFCWRNSGASGGKRRPSCPPSPTWLHPSCIRYPVRAVSLASTGVPISLPGCFSVALACGRNCTPGIGKIRIRTRRMENPKRESTQEQLVGYWVTTAVGIWMGCSALAWAGGVNWFSTDFGYFCSAATARNAFAYIDIRYTYVGVWVFVLATACVGVYVMRVARFSVIIHLIFLIVNKLVITHFIFSKSFFQRLQLFTLFWRLPRTTQGYAFSVHSISDWR